VGNGSVKPPPTSPRRGNKKFEIEKALGNRGFFYWKESLKAMLSVSVEVLLFKIRIASVPKYPIMNVQ
jgi:hypothetical protein